VVAGSSPEPFPAFVEGLFWDRVPGSVRWSEHREFVIERVLTDGTWEATKWLRRFVTDDELRAWIRRTRARRLEARTARFWQFVLDIPEAELRDRLSDPARQIWDRRTA
jgi:hypothetical protein